MIKTFTLSLFILLLLCTKSFSCSCSIESDNYGFYNVVSNKNTNVIVVLDSLSKISNGRYSKTGYFTIIDTINSSGYKIGDTVNVIGQDGSNCNQLLNIFKKGDTLVVTLDKWNNLSGCVNHYLKITNGLNNNLSIKSIKNKINDIVTANNIKKVHDNISVFPNPSNGIVNVEIVNLDVKNVKIINTIGQEVFILTTIATKNFTINTSHLQAGIYTIILETAEDIISKQVVIF